MRAGIIVNPRAGRGKGIQVAQDAGDFLRGRGWSVEIRPTEYRPSDQEASATAIARRLSGDVDRIIVVGGDGTLREVVTGIGAQANNLCIALVPLGNANVIAREFNLPLDVGASIPLLTGSREVHMDVGSVNGRTFLAMVGVGYDALVIHVVNRCRNGGVGSRIYQLPWGADILYGLGGLAAAMRLLPQRFELSVDGRAANRTYPTIWISNVRTYAKGWSITPEAHAADGKLHYHACKRAGLIRPLRVLYHAMKKQRSPKWISDYGVAEKIRIQGAKPFHWQIDGDSMPPATALDMEILPGYFRFLVP